MNEYVVYDLSVHMISVSFFFATPQRCWPLLVQVICKLPLQADQSSSTENGLAELSLILCVVMS